MIFRRGRSPPLADDVEPARSRSARWAAGRIGRLGRSLMMGDEAGRGAGGRARGRSGRACLWPALRGGGWKGSGRRRAAGGRGCRGCRAYGRRPHAFMPRGSPELVWARMCGRGQSVASGGGMSDSSPYEPRVGGTQPPGTQPDQAPAGLGQSGPGQAWATAAPGARPASASASATPRRQWLVDGMVKGDAPDEAVAVQPPSPRTPASATTAAHSHGQLSGLRGTSGREWEEGGEEEEEQHLSTSRRAIRSLATPPA